MWYGRQTENEEDKLHIRFASLNNRRVSLTVIKSCLVDLEKSIEDRRVQTLSIVN